MRTPSCRNFIACASGLAMFLALALLVGACGAKKPDGVRLNEAQIMGSVQTGTIIHVEEIAIKSSSNVASEGVFTSALHLTIDLDNGQMIRLVQMEDDIYMSGDRVRVLYDKNGKAYAQQL